MNYTGERMVPWNRATGKQVMQCHIARYAWAIQHVFDKHVVDLGCGTGYGSFMLSWAAKSVLGVDISKEAIEYAKARFDDDSLCFRASDISKVFLSADVYVAFEVLEHLDFPQRIVERFKPLVWSIPVNDANVFHRRAYSVSEIDVLMGISEWFQDKEGLIVRREVAWFDPVYVLGVTA